MVTRSKGDGHNYNRADLYLFDKTKKAKKKDLTEFEALVDFL